MYKYPKIGQYRDALHELKENGYYGKVVYEGRVKLHGTNASIVFEEAVLPVCQSRNRQITPDDDNLGFAAWVSSLSPEIIEALCVSEYSRESRDGIKRKVVVYGEWVGKGIQSGVGICHMERAFVIFDIRYVVGEESEEHGIKNFRPRSSHLFNKVQMDVLNEARIFHIDQFPSFMVTVDVQRPHLAQSFIHQATMTVEDCCPVAEILASIPDGVSNTGEGLVWKPVNSYIQTKFWFKSKGEKHSATRVKTIAPVNLELAESVSGFVDSTITNARCSQGIDYLREMGLPVSQRSTGAFLKWVVGDVLDEESDVLEASGLARKDVTKSLSNKAKAWFFKIVNHEASNDSYEETTGSRHLRSEDAA